MSYTFKEVTWKSSTKIPNTDVYGDLVYSRGILVVARKQPKNRIVVTSGGKEVLCKSVYYIDPKKSPDVEKIKRFDLLDDELIEDVYIMCNLVNKPTLYRFITI